MMGLRGGDARLSFVPSGKSLGGVILARVQVFRILSSLERFCAYFSGLLNASLWIKFVSIPASQRRLALPLSTFSARS